MSNVHVIDAVMGSGKTEAMINYIKNASPDRHFIYVTPYLTEVDRIKKDCADKNFYEPRSFNKKTSKLKDLKNLLDKQRNIVTTHALFHMFDDEVMDLCLTYNYELIMDEVTDVIEAYDISESDMNILLDHCVYIDENGFLVWRDNQDDYDGRFDDVKRLVDMKCLALYGKTVMLWLFPVEIFRAFRQSFILTYMFDAQMQSYYYKYYNLEYDHYYVKGTKYPDYSISKTPTGDRPKKNYRKLITVCEEEKLNNIGGIGNSGKYALSLNWYRTNKKNSLFDTVAKNTRTFYKSRNTVLTEDGSWRKCTANEFLWTVFIQDPEDKKSAKSQFKKRISRKISCANGFLACTTRASNEYRDRNVVAYLVNRFMTPTIKNFFVQHGVEVHEDEFALSEMLQFIWRSAIREYKHITVYVPSIRMRSLLEQWIEENSVDEEEAN